MFRLIRRCRQALLGLSLLCSLWSVRMASAQVTNLADAGAGSLRAAMLVAAPGSTITFTAGLSGSINLLTPLPIINGYNIDAANANITVSGLNTRRVFFADQGTIAIRNLTIAAGNATGGRGGDSNTGGGGGGGGLGAGGGLYVNNLANVTVSNVIFQNNRAVGGAGGSSTGTAITGLAGLHSAGGAGGGLGGNGGNSNGTSIGLNIDLGGGGGGGLYGNGANAGAGDAGGGAGGQVGNGGIDVNSNGGGGGGTTANGANATAAAGGVGGATGGGNGGTGFNGFPGGPGGGGGGGGTLGQGGNGGRNGGGGGAGTGPGGNGGDHGGGGGGVSVSPTSPGTGSGGNGGYGGGGGGDTLGAGAGVGGFGAGNGGIANAFSGNGGGGGSGFGGAVFVRQGGTLTVVDSNLPTGNTVGIGVGGTGGPVVNGISAGGAFYLDNVNLNYISSAGVTNTVGDSIAGNGSLFSNGQGILNLTGNSTYTGQTIVNSGTLAVNGSIISSVQVNALGILAGNGRVGSTIVNGTIAPGNSIGVLTINGNYVQNPGSTYQVELNAQGQSDQIQVLGTATINGGTIQVLGTPGNYGPGQRFTILVATGGRTGVYTNLTQTGVSRMLVALYSADRVELVTALSPSETLSVARTPNQLAVFNIINNPGASPAIQALFNSFLIQTTDEARRSLDQLSGVIYPNILVQTQVNSLLTGNLLLDQLYGTLQRPQGCGGCEDPNDPYSCGWNTWFKMRFTLGYNSNNNNSIPGVNALSGGFLVGLDRWLSDTTRVGIYGGYNHAHLDLRGFQDDASLDTYDIGVTGSQTLGAWYGMGFLGYSFQDLRAQRTISFGGINQQINSPYDGNLFNGGLEGGRSFTHGDFLFQPLVGFQYLSLDQSDVSEARTGPASLNVTGLHASTLWTSAGARFGWSIDFGDVLMQARGTAKVMHNPSDEDRAALVQLVGGGAPFTVVGAKIGQNPFWGSAGLSFNYRDYARLYYDYSILTSPHHTVHMGTGGIEFRW